MTINNGSKVAQAPVINDAIVPPVQIAINKEELQELDYIAVKSLDQAMLIIAGTRLENPEEIIDGSISAIGSVYLQIGTQRIKLGEMTEDALQFDQAAIGKLFSANFSTEDLLSIKSDALKAWCLKFKLAAAKTKAVATKSKNEARLAKSKALLQMLGG